MNAIVKVYGSQILKNNEPYMVIDKLVVDFVVKGARFKVKDVGVNQLSKEFIKLAFYLIELNEQFLLI